MQKHEFKDGDLVVFSEVEGMDEINGMEPVEIKVLSTHCIEVAIDTSESSPYWFRGKGNSLHQLPHTVNDQSNISPCLHSRGDARWKALTIHESR